MAIERICDKSTVVVLWDRVTVMSLKAMIRICARDVLRKSFRRNQCVAFYLYERLDINFKAKIFQDLLFILVL